VVGSTTLVAPAHAHQADKTPIRATPASASRESVRAQLQQQLFDELKTQGAPRMSGQGSVFEQYPYAQENVRNFYERHMRGEKVKAGWVRLTDFEKERLE
jgi:N-sulfoglucosamine sulfohydrolase